MGGVGGERPFGPPVDPDQNAAPNCGRTPRNEAAIERSLPLLYSPQLTGPCADARSAAGVGGTAADKS